MWCARVFISELNSLEWVAILVARVAVGLLFFLSGRAKLFVPGRREEMRQTLIKAHVVFPGFNAAFVSTVEFVCGLLLVLGAMTPLASALLAGVMFGFSFQGLDGSALTTCFCRTHVCSIRDAMSRCAAIQRALSPVEVRALGSHHLVIATRAAHETATQRVCPG